MPFCLAGRVWSAAVCAERAVCWPTSARRWWIWWRRWLNASITGRWMPRVAAADSRGMALQVLQRLGDRLLMRGTDLRGGLEPAKPVQQAHTLGRAEGQVEPGDAVATGRAAQPLRRDRMGAGEQAVQPLLSDLSGQPELLCRLAEPVAGRLPRPGVVLLLASRDSVQVVVGLALQELADVEHAGPRGARRGRRDAPASHPRLTGGSTTGPSYSSSIPRLSPGSRRTVGGGCAAGRATGSCACCRGRSCSPG